MTSERSPESSEPRSWRHEDLSELASRDQASRRWHRRRAGLLFLLGVLFTFWFVPFIPALFFSTITVTRLDAKGKPINVEVGPGTKNWISIEKVSRHFVHAVVVAEDAKFYQHFGFDFESIGKAIDVNRKKGRYARGASTISQQLVKIAFLSREKTIIRKVREAVGTIFLELLLSKNQILEWYINLCEFGGGIYGVKTAGMYYFKTRPELLTIEQAVNLVVVIPSPNKWSKGLRAKSLTPFGQRRFARIVRNLYLAGYITNVQRDTALARGNFGQPVVGGESLEAYDDCNGDRDCEEGLRETQETPALQEPITATPPVIADPATAVMETPSADEQSRDPSFQDPSNNNSESNSQLNLEKSDEVSDQQSPGDAMEAQ